MATKQIEYPSRGETYYRDEYGVYEYGVYPSYSVLAGQQKRVFLDSFDREHTVSFKDLLPSAGTDPGAPALDQVSQVLFVVDLTNTKPGSSGRFWIKSAVFQR